MVTARLKSLHLLFASLLTIVLFSTFTAAQNPVGIWKFNEGSGDAAYDASGTGRTALLSSGMRWVQTGNTWTISSARTRGGYVTIPSVNLSQTKAVTVTLWVKRLYTSNSGGVLFEADKGGRRSDSEFALLPDDETCHGMQAVLRGVEGTTANCYAQPSSGAWHHFALVYDKSQTGGNAIVLYMDGALQNPTWNLSAGSSSNNFSADPVYLLSRAGTSQFTQGTISDFRIYDGALGSDEIQQIYNETMLATPASASYVQGNYADPQTMQTSLGVLFNSAQTAGNLNVVVIGWKDSRATISQVTDSAGNTYTRGVGPTIINGTATQAMYYAKNIAAAGAGANTVTVTFSTSATKPDVRIAEYSGIDPTNPVDVTAAASGNGRTSSSGNAQTTNATDLIVGADLVQSITSGPGSGFTKRLLSSPQGNILEDKSVTSAGSYSATAPLMPSSKWIMQMMALRTRNVVLQSITVTPNNPSIPVGGHQQFAATGNYSDGSHQDLTSSATWSSSNQSVATINNTGYATGVAAGTSTIKAASGTISGTTTLTVTPSATFTLTASPNSLSVLQGNQGTSTITTTGQNGFSSSISLSANGAPTGTSITFNPNPIPSPGSGNSTMTITVGASTPAGTYPITVTGNGGGVQQSATVTLTVVAGGGAGITLDGNLHGVQDNGQGSTSSASLYLGTPHAGDLITCEVSFDSGNGNSLVSVSDPNNGTYAAAVPMHLNSGMRQLFGIYYMQNAVASDTTVTIQTSQSRAWLAISCQAWQGAATSNVLDTSFAQLQDASGMPNPTTGTNRMPASNGELVVAGAGLVNGGTPGAGNQYALIDGAISTQWWPEYWIQGTATSTAGNFTWPTDTWTDVMAAFKPATTGSGNFSISASPSSITVAQGNQGTSTITTTVTGGFNSSISLSASGVPSGTSVAFNPTTIGAPGNGSSTMTVTVGTSTPAGTYPITVTGNGGGIQQSTTVSLTVSAGPNFSISASPSSLTVMEGTQGTSTLTTTISGGFNGAISLAASGVPSGTTVSFNPTTIPAPGAGTSAMTITVGSSTRIGTYPITVTATSGATQQTVTVNLTVTAQVALSWSGSQGAMGYNIYRATTSGGPYTRINGSLDSNTAYNDQAVQDGVTYYYVTTAVDSQGQESSYSNQASATLP